MINFKDYESSERLRAFDNWNLVVHNNMTKLQNIFRSLSDDVIFSKEQLNLINKINDLIKIESQTNSIWESTTTKLIVDLTHNEVNSNESILRKIEEVSKLGEMTLESKVRKKSFFAETQDKLQHNINLSYLLIGVGFVLSLFGVILIDVLNGPTSYFHFMTFAFFGCLMLPIGYIFESVGRIFHSIKKKTKAVKYMSISLITLGIIGLNPLTLICGVSSLINNIVGIKKLNSFEILSLFDSIKRDDVSHILEYIDDDYYISKLIELTQNFPEGASQETCDKIEEHLNHMNESIRIINND